MSLKEIKEYISELERQAENAASEIPEEFNSPEDAEEWQYYNGYLWALRDLKKYIGE